MQGTLFGYKDFRPRQLAGIDMKLRCINFPPFLFSFFIGAGITTIHIITWTMHIAAVNFNKISI
jgi:hypothetical protein